MEKNLEPLFNKLGITWEEYLRRQETSNINYRVFNLLEDKFNPLLSDFPKLEILQELKETLELYPYHDGNSDADPFLEITLKNGEVIDTDWGYFLIEKIEGGKIFLEQNEIDPEDDEPKIYPLEFEIEQIKSIALFYDT